MKRTFETVAIVGVGLLGGSLGLALKRRGVVKRVYGVGRRRESLDTAIAQGAIDEAFLTLDSAVERADGIVICTPAADVCRYLDRLRPLASKALFITDVASTKAEICAHASKTWLKPRRFVGSHPMAGSEKFGPEHADPDLYVDAVCIVESTNQAAPDAQEAVRDLWKSVGARVVEVEPAEHDRIVARTSHVPHIAAAALAKIANLPVQDLAPFIGNGFRDTTRVAEGRPEVWRDICSTNREAIAEGLDDLVAILDRVRRQLRGGDSAALEAFFTEGRDARLKILGQ